MLNKKLIVALLAVVILFLGIFSFAQSNNNDDKDKTPSTKDENTPKDNSGDQPTVGDETDNQGGTDITVPARNNVSRAAVVADTTDPVITLNGDAEITVDLNQSYTDAGATATDNVTANVAVTATSTVNTSTAGVYQVLYTATDGAGNTASLIRTVKVRPLIIQPSNYSHEVNTPLDEDALAATLVLGPKATTSMGPTNIDTINVNALGDYVLTYTYEYTSEAGNVNATVKYMTVSVVDTTKPVITINKNDKEKTDLVYEVDKTNANQYVELGATLTDNYDSNSNVTDITIEKKNDDDSWTKVDSIDTSVISEYRVKYNGKDSNNNSATEVIRAVKVVDTKAPAINLYEGSTLVLNPTVTIEGKEVFDETYHTFKAYDYYDGQMFDKVTKKYYKYNDTTKEWDEVAGINTNVLGNYKITYNVSDNAGNKATQKVRLVNVVDSRAPAINLYEGSTLVLNPTVTVEGKGVFDETYHTFRAYDYFDGQMFDKVIKKYYKYNNATKEWDEVAKINTNILGQYKITYNVTDNTGNKATEKVRLVNVVDTKVPVINLYEGSTMVLNPTVTVNINEAFDETYHTYRAQDYFDGSMFNKVIKKYYQYNATTAKWDEIAKINTSVLGQYKITYNVSDSSSNVAVEKVRLVNVIDVTKPVVTLKDGDKVVEINTSFVDPGVTITDNSNEKLFPSLTVYYSTTGADGTWVGAPDNKVDTSKLGKYAIWYGAKDSSNNVADAVRRYVTVVDTTKPVVTLKEGDKVVEINTTFTDPGVTITDNSNEVLNPILTVYYSKTGADGTWVGALDNKVDTSKLGKYAVWYGAKDSSNNSATTVRRYVTVVDTTKPVVTLKEGDKVVEINTAFTDPGVTITDNSNEVLNPILIVYYSKTGADGTWVGASGNKVDTSKLGKYAVWYGAKDSSNNSATTVRRYVTVVDTTKPVVTLKEGDKVVEVNTAFTDPGVTITDNSNEVLNPILTVYYSKTGADGTWVGAPGNKVDTSKLGKYAVWYGAKDSSNNVADAVRRYVTIVDTTIPTIDTVSGNPSDWTKNDVTLTVTATDNNKIFQYSFDNGANWQNENTKVFSSNQDVTILVKDESGNTSNAYVEHITKIDKSSPSLKVEDPNQSYAPAKSFSRKVTVSDSTSGLDDSSLKYLWSTSRDASLPLVSTTGTSFKSGDNVTSPVGVTGKYYLLIEVKDNAGNKSIYMSWGFDIDNTLPQINSVSGNPNSWTNQDITLTINATDNSNVMDTKAYSFDNGQTWQSENTKAFSSNQDVTMLVKDSAGNISNAYVEHITKIDKSAPSLSVEDPNQSYAPARSFSRRVTVSDSASGLDDSSLKYLWSTSRDASLSLVSTTGTSFKSGDNVTSPVGVTGKYYLLIEVKDNAGNKSTYMSWGFDIDNDLPQINSVSGNPSSWTNQDVTLTVNATDSTDNLEYSFDNGANWQSENTKAFSSNQDVNILVRDAVGNISNTYIERISMIDKELPVINSVSGNSSVWTNSDITLTVSASDNVGITQYSFDNGANWQAANTLTFTGNANPAILAKDAAGNVSLVYNEAITKIDKAVPSLTVTQPEENMIIFDADYISSFAISGTDSLSGIRVIKYAKGLYTVDNFPAGASVVPASGIIAGVVADETYTIYAEDNVGNKVVATKTVTNILGSDDTKNINDLQINVGTRKWRASGFYRQLQVKTLGSTKIVSFDQRVGYLPLSAFSGVPVTRDVNTLTEDIERDLNTPHTVYLKDSTGKEYVIWVEIIGALGE